MRPRRSRSGYSDVLELELEDEVDVALDEDEVPDEFLALLREIAAEAIAARATWPGEPTGDAQPDDRDARPDEEHLARRTRVRRRVVWGAAVGLALAAVGIGDLVADRQAQARAAVLAAQPGVLAPISAPLVEQWRIAGRVITAGAEDLLVEHEGRLARVEPSTGAFAWTGDAAPATAISPAQLAAASAGASAARTQEQALPGGFTVSWTWHEGGTTGQGRVASDQGRAFALLGPPLVPPVSDGSSARTLVLTTVDGDRLRAVSLRGGSRLWSVPFDGGPDLTAVAQVDDVLLLDDGGRVTAVDGRDGRRVWTTDRAPQVRTPPVLIAGGAALLGEAAPGGGVDLVARRMADGVELWRTPAPDGAVALTVVDQRLVVSTADAVMGLVSGP